MLPEILIRENVIFSNPKFILNNLSVVSILLQVDDDDRFVGVYCGNGDRSPVFTETQHFYIMSLFDSFTYFSFNASYSLVACEFFLWKSELQIRGGIEDNSKIFFLFQNENNIVTTH